MKTIIGVLTILVIVFGAYFYIDNRYAHSQELKMVENRLDQKILYDRLDRVQEDIKQIKKDWKGKKMDEDAIEDFQKLQKKQDKIEKQLEELEKK